MDYMFNATRETNTTSASSNTMCLAEFLSHNFPEDKQLLGKLILEKTIGMLAGPRGCGKSWLALLISYAISGSKELYPWGTGTGATVAYLDGEMRAQSLQARLRSLHARNTKTESIAAVGERLFIISRDGAGETIGAIDTPNGQDLIDAQIPASTKLIVLDNLSAWTTGGREDAESWATVKRWLIQKRLNGVAVLIIHHTGKNGKQRGSSAHEDLLDYSILISSTSNAVESADTRFLVDHTKLRDYIPDLRQRYEFSIWTEEDGTLEFKVIPTRPPNEGRADIIRQMSGEGRSLGEIAEALCISKSTVSRSLGRTRNSSHAQ